MMQPPPPYVPLVEYVLKALEHPPYMYVAKLAACCTMLFLTRENPELLQELCGKWAARFAQDRRRLIRHIRKRASYCVSSPDSTTGLSRDAKVSSEDASEDSSTAIAGDPASAEEEEEAMNCSDTEKAVEHLLSILNTLVPMYFSWNWHRADYVIQINKEYEVFVREYILPMCAELAPDEGVDDVEHTPWLLPPHKYLEASQSVSSFYTPTSTVSQYPHQRSPRRVSSMVSTPNLPASVASAAHTPRQPPPPPSAPPSSRLGASLSGSPTMSVTEMDGVGFSGMQQHYPTSMAHKKELHPAPLPKFSPTSGKRGAGEPAAIAAPVFTPASTQASGSVQSCINAAGMSPNVVTGRAFNAAAVYGLRFLSLGNYRDALLSNTTGLVTVFHAKYSVRSNEIIDAFQAITTKRLLNPMPTIALVYGVAEPELSSLYKVSWFPTVVYTPPLRYQRHRHRKPRRTAAAAAAAAELARTRAAKHGESGAAGPHVARAAGVDEEDDEEEDEAQARSLCTSPEMDTADSEAASPVQRMKLPRADTAEGFPDSSPTPPQLDNHGMTISAAQRAGAPPVVSPRLCELHAHHPLADSAPAEPCDVEETAGEEEGATESVRNDGADHSAAAACAISVSSIAAAAAASQTAKVPSPDASPRLVASAPVVALTDVTLQHLSSADRTLSGLSPANAKGESRSARFGSVSMSSRRAGSCSAAQSPTSGACLGPAPPTPTELLFGFSVSDGVPGPSGAAPPASNASILSSSSIQSSTMGDTLRSLGESGSAADGTTESLMEMLARDDHVIYPMDGVQTVPALVEWISSRGASVPRLRKMKEFFSCIKNIRKEEKFKRFRELHSAVVTLRRLQGIKDDSMKGGAGNSTSSSGSAPSTSTQTSQQPDQPLFIFLGGGMAAGKTTAVAALAKSSWWESHKEQSVVVNADEFKLPMDCEEPSPEAHTHSTRAAENLLVKVINQGRSIVLDGTMMWKPFVQQVVAMVREAHLTLFEQGPGYNRRTRVERYFVADKPRKPALPMPYKIIFLGITVEVETAVPRGFLRKFQTNRGVPLSMQLRSFKLFAENFAAYVALMDETTLYNNNIFVDLEKGELPPVLAECTEETQHKLLVHDEAAFQLFLRQQHINDNADNILEVYPASPTSQ